MYNLVKVLVVILLLLYPVFIYFGLSHFSPAQLSLFLLSLFAIRAVFTRNSNKTARIQIVLTVLIGGTLAVLTWVFNSAEYLKWYPVGLNAVFFFVFAASLISPPTMIEQMARTYRKDMSPSRIAYLRNVTIVWSAFFLGNSLIASWTVLYGSLETWTLYNGLISYIIMGLLFGVEILLRRFFIKSERDDL